MMFCDVPEERTAARVSSLTELVIELHHALPQLGVWYWDGSAYLQTQEPSCTLKAHPEQRDLEQTSWINVVWLGEKSKASQQYCLQLDSRSAGISLLRPHRGRCAAHHAHTDVAMRAVYAHPTCRWRAWSGN